ncbi:MAG: TatD family hydrolase [Ferrovibrionaceae bacterium]
MTLIDSHCHLDYFAAGPERDDIVNRARAAGVRTMLTIGTKLHDFPAVRAIAESDPDIWCTVGLHPHEADKEPDIDAARLIAETAHPKVVGVGETGLDYFYDHSDRDQQQRSFRAHLQAARATGLPVVIHTRDADDDTCAILKDEMGQGAFSGLIHCFTSSAALARTALDLGLSISLSGIVTFKNAGDIRETARFIPRDRLLVETDSPYLAPVPKRGQKNEPAFVVHTAAFLAKELGMANEELAELTTANFFRLFSKAQPHAGKTA